MSTDRGRRLEHQQKAYELQVKGGIEGAAKWTVYGAAVVTLAHYSWPLFRRQTWALKAFLTSSASIVGLVIGADKYLLQYENTQRREENDVRRRARNALAREGVIASEGEIRKWRAKEDEKDKAAAAISTEGTPSA